RSVGALLLRSVSERPPLEPRAIDFLRLAATQIGLLLRSARVFDALKEQTRRTSLNRYSEERRTRALEQYRDFFEASTDGLLVAGEDGSVLYFNRAAEQMTGYARDGLKGRSVLEIVAEPQRDGLLQIIRKVVAGVN